MGLFRDIQSQEASSDGRVIRQEEARLDILEEVESGFTLVTWTEHC